MGVIVLLFTLPSREGNAIGCHASPTKRRGIPACLREQEFSKVPNHTSISDGCDDANSDSNLEYDLGDVPELLDPVDLHQLSGH